MSFNPAAKPPLPELLRPASIGDMCGQQHLLAPGKPLRLALDSGAAHSMILFGPPGVGKTTLGKLAAGAFNLRFLSMSGSTGGVKEMRDAIESAKSGLAEDGRQSMLFIDEIHRLNKTQQDALLPHVETGLITLCAATTENPSFSVNSALLSRCQTYEMRPLERQDLALLAKRALPSMAPIRFEKDALGALATLCSGDGRKFLGSIEICRAAAIGSKRQDVDAAFAAECLGKPAALFDKQGDLWHEMLSAFHKSVRASQPDAALFYLARMALSGGDCRQAARRMVAIASEDIGNADPAALPMAVAALQAYEKLGSPEGELALAQTAAYLACAPKSNAAYLAWTSAKAMAQSLGSAARAPLALRNAPTELMRQLGFKEGYRYPHDEPGAYAAGAGPYLPEGAEGGFYKPNNRGAEEAIAARLAAWKAADEAAKGQKNP